MDPSGLSSVPASPNMLSGVTDWGRGWEISGGDLILYVSSNKNDGFKIRGTDPHAYTAMTLDSGAKGSGGGGGGSRSGAGSGNNDPKGANNPNPDSSPDIDTDLLSSALDFGELVAEDLGKSKIANVLGKINILISGYNTINDYNKTGSVSTLAYDMTGILVAFYVGELFVGAPAVIAGIGVGLAFEISKNIYNDYIYPYIYDKYNQFRNNIHNQAVGNWMNYH